MHHQPRREVAVCVEEWVATGMHSKDTGGKIGDNEEEHKRRRRRLRQHPTSMDDDCNRRKAMETRDFTRRTHVMTSRTIGAPVLADGEVERDYLHRRKIGIDSTKGFVFGNSF